MNFKKDIIVAVSGGFDPLHIGHLRMIQEAKKLGDKLIVFVNDDSFLIRKKGYAFMNQEDRMEILKGLRGVDEVFLVIDNDHSVCKTLEKYKPDIFANGGDRKNGNDIPEYNVCINNNIKMIFDVGGEKVRSSSELCKISKNIFKY